LGDGLLASTSTSAPSATAAASASTLSFAAGDGLARWLLVGSGGFFTNGLRFKFRFGSGRDFNFVMGLDHRTGRLLRVEVGGLQRRGRRLTSLLGRFLLAAL
jgi:hypothetical protein